MEIKDFTELLVWQRAMDLVVDVYRVTESYPRAELFALTAQSHRAAVSIPANIAEGFCRRSTAAYVNHLNIALGSEGELFTQLKIGERLGYVSSKSIEKPLNELGEVGRMLNGLIRSLEEKQAARGAVRCTTGNIGDPGP